MNESEHIRRNRKKWDRWSEVADGQGPVFDHLRRSQSKLISILDLKEGISLLDMGCGTGWAVGQIARTLGFSGKFYGADLSEKMLARARENHQGLSNIYFIQSNSENVLLESDMFDIIICTNSFHHYLHPERAVKEFHRLLKKGGKLYILDPAADMFIIKVVDMLIKLIEPEHVKIYSSAEFRGMFIASGMKYLDSVPTGRGEKVQIAEKI